MLVLIFLFLSLILLNDCFCSSAATGQLSSARIIVSNWYRI